MASLTSARNRRTLCLWTLGVVALLGSGCQQTALPRAVIGLPRNRQPAMRDLEMVNAGYCETRWIALTRVFGTNGYVEHYADDAPTALMLEAPNDQFPLAPADAGFPSSRPLEPSPSLTDRRPALPAAQGDDAGSVTIVDSLD